MSWQEGEGGGVITGKNQGGPHGKLVSGNMMLHSTVWVAGPATHACGRAPGQAIHTVL